MTPLRLLLLAAAGAFACGQATPPTTVETITNVSAGDRAGQGDLWFVGWTPTLGFRVTSSDPADVTRALELLSRAAKSSTSVVVRFDASSGRYDVKRGRIMFRVCSIAAADAPAITGALCARAATAPPAVDRTLAQGVALAEIGRSAEALPWLDRALAGPLDPPRTIIVRRTRAEARERAGLVLAASPERDKLLAAALDDARAWTALARGDAEGALQVAGLQAELGGYDEAIAGYRAIIARWPEEDYRATIRIGAVQRVLGNNRAALAELDGLVKRHGPQNGMKFHYHRGWTLTLLGREPEAVAELTAGLTDQPDYTWALIRRACAFGRLAQVRLAAADQRAAVALLDRSRSAFGDLSDVAKANLARAQAVAVSLDAAAKDHPDVATTVACDGYVEDQVRRERSPLLR